MYSNDVNYFDGNLSFPLGFSDLAEMERLFPPLKLIDAN